MCRTMVLSTRRSRHKILCILRQTFNISAIRAAKRASSAPWHKRWSPARFWSFGSNIRWSPLCLGLCLGLLLRFSCSCEALIES